jgi:hypothetical protein
MMNVQAVTKAVAESPELQARMQADPLATLQALSAMAPALVNDKWNYRITIGGITFSLLASVVGGEILAAYGKTIPESVVGIGSAALAALALLLRPQSEKS